MGLVSVGCGYAWFYVVRGTNLFGMCAYFRLVCSFLWYILVLCLLILICVYDGVRCYCGKLLLFLLTEMLS